MPATAKIATAMAARQERFLLRQSLTADRAMLWCTTPNRALFDERLIEAIVPVRESPALFVDILLRVEPGDQRLDTLLLRIGWSRSLCLLCVIGRASKVTC